MKPDDYQIGGAHYQSMGVAPWAIIDTWPLEQRIGFYRGTALAYIMRAGLKGDQAEDLAKARHYLDKLTTILEGN